MKSNPLTAALVAVLAVCAVMTVVLSVTFTLKLRKLGAMQAQINNNSGFLRSLSADSLEYSKKNPAIIPLLQTFGVISPEPKPATAPAPAKPAGK